MPHSKLVKTSLSVALLKTDVATPFVICAESSRIRKWGKRYYRFTNQHNILSHQWFKNTTDLDHKL